MDQEELGAAFKAGRDPLPRPCCFSFPRGCHHVGQDGSLPAPLSCLLVYRNVTPPFCK